MNAKQRNGLLRRGLDFFMAPLCRAQIPLVHAPGQHAFVIKRLDVSFVDPETGVASADSAGIYKFSRLIADTISGISFLCPPSARSWPIALDSSAMDDIQCARLREGRYGGLLRRLSSRRPLESRRPVFIATTRRQKGNYGHFLTEDFAKLITFMESAPEPVDILDLTSGKPFMAAMIDHVADIYGSKVLRPERGDFCLDLRDVYVMDHVHKLHYRSFSHSASRLERQIAEDPQENRAAVSLAALEASFENDLVPHHWTASGTTLINKQTAILPSRTCFEALASFADKVLLKNDTHIPDGQHVYASRKADTDRGRRIANEADLLKAMPSFNEVDFGLRPWLEQIAAVRNAKVFAGPTGAALCNLAFMKPGTALVEFLPYGFSFPLFDYFHNLAVVKGLHYQRILASREDGEGRVPLDSATTALARFLPSPMCQHSVS